MLPLSRKHGIDRRKLSNYYIDVDLLSMNVSVLTDEKARGFYEEKVVNRHISALLFRLVWLQFMHMSGQMHARSSVMRFAPFPVNFTTVLQGIRKSTSMRLSYMVARTLMI